MAVFFLTLPLLTACSSKVPHEETFRRGRLVYQAGSETAFSGVVTGRSREGYRRQVCTYEKSYQDGRLHGVSRFWYPNGQLESVVNYANGVMDGMATRYYSDGKLKARIHFSKGMRGGSKGEMFWGPDGKRRRG